MSNILPWDREIKKGKAALWWLGQAGYYIKSGGVSVLIDPYLSDSVGKSNPLFARSCPVPVNPGEIKADYFIVTHDHTDHLDPETLEAYAHKENTVFIAPRHAAKKLMELGIGENNIKIVDHGDRAELPGVCAEGIFALATGKDVLDTCGYKLTFENGKSVYHNSDTAFCDLLLKACPNADVLLTCINGKFGNLNIQQAIELTRFVNPKYVIPNHYDVMALNSENPESFRYFCQNSGGKAEIVILKNLELFEW